MGRGEQAAAPCAGPPRPPPGAALLAGAAGHPEPSLSARTAGRVGPVRA
jgi:hypothetical protein